MPSKKEARARAHAAAAASEKTEGITKKKTNDNKTAFTKSIGDMISDKTKGTRVTKKAKVLMNMLALSGNRRITQHAMLLKNERKESTVTADGVTFSLRMLMGPEMAKRAIARGEAAVQNYLSSKAAEV